VNNLSLQWLRRPLYQWAAAAIIVTAAVTFGYLAQGTHASGGPGSLTLSPARGSFTAGQVVTVEVSVNTGGTPVNAIQADFTYPTSKLQFQSIDATGSVMSIDAASTGHNGVVSIARGNTTPYTGAGRVAAIHFLALSGGSANLVFAGTSHVVSSTDNTDVLGSATGAKYTLKRPKASVTQALADLVQGRTLTRLVNSLKGAVL
jgi:hypothetical protein